MNDLFYSVAYKNNYDNNCHASLSEIRQFANEIENAINDGIVTYDLQILCYNINDCIDTKIKPNTIDNILAIFRMYTE